MDRAALSPGLRPDDRLVVLGDVPAEWLPDGHLQRFPYGPGMSTERVPVSAAIGWARTLRPRQGRVVIVTGGDLHIPECESLFGFADARAKVVLVSTFRIATSNAAQTRRRVVNEIAHELGHLDGLKHCPHTCVMRPIADPRELDDRPATPCGKCPRSGSWVLRTLAVLAAVLILIAVGGRLFDRRVVLRPPALPLHVAALVEEFPADTGYIASRPVTLITQAFDANSTGVALTTAASTLPPDVQGDHVARAAVSMASVQYRTPQPDPIVHVHVFEARGSLPGLLEALGCSAAEAAAPGKLECQRRTGDADTYVLSLPPRRAMLVFAPGSSSREMAARLASLAGRGGGLRNDRDMTLVLGALPSRAPDGFAFDALSAANVHRVPEAIDEIARRFFHDDGPAAAVQFRRVMPIAVINAGYRGGGGRRAGVVIGYYSWTPSAWVSRFTIGRILAPWDAGAMDLASGRGWRLDAGSRHYALWRQGRFVAAVYADGPERPEPLLRALADAMQF